MTTECGTNRTYINGCRCQACRDAHTAYSRHRARERAYGRGIQYVDATSVREHLAVLGRAGIGWKHVARLAGINPSVIERIIYGRNQPSTKRPPSRRVRADIANQILAIPADPALAAGGTRCDATGTRRRIQALAALGWTIATIARSAGVNRLTIDRILAGNSTTHRTARAIARIYNQLSMVLPAPSTVGERSAVARIVARAERAGWAPPLAWDDDTIDDPAAQPDTGHETHADIDPIIEDVAELLAWGEHPAQIADRLGIKAGTLEKRCRRAGHLDLANRFNQAHRAGRQAAA